MNKYLNNVINELLKIEIIFKLKNIKYIYISNCHEYKYIKNIIDYDYFYLKIDDIYIYFNKKSQNLTLDTSEYESEKLFLNNINYYINDSIFHEYVIEIKYLKQLITNIININI